MKFSFLIRIILMAALTFAMLAAPGPAQAQIACTITGTITVADIQPRSLVNTADVNLVVTGTNFTAGAVVVLQNFGALNTTMAGGTLLTATVPAGIRAGTYNVQIIDPTNGTAVCNGALTVTAPAPPTATAAPTNTPAPTAFIRPIIQVDSYAASSPEVSANQDLDFEITFVNWGTAPATNIVAEFGGSDFQPRVTGGVRVSVPLAPNEKYKMFQPLTTQTGVAGKPLATLEVKVSYTDPNGAAYNETFAITFPVRRPTAVTSTPTPTATPSPRPQLLIDNYKSDVEVLKPGTRFTLTIEVRNAGNADAQRVTAILGGGTVSGSPPSGGTPGAGGSGGGVSGGGGSFDNFAPIESSNVQSIGDVGANGTATFSQTLIVNAATKPAAYPVKFSFTYTDAKGASFTDEQVITLLVYSPPFVDISFYREPGQLLLGQPNVLPIQVVNLGRSNTVLGNMKVTAAGADLSNNTILVGNLDAGNYFTLDANAIPAQPGPLELTVTVDYVDDFNQPQTITKTLMVEVIDIPTPPPSPGGGDGGFPPLAEPEGPMQIVIRFISGFLGFDSGPSNTAAGQPVQVETQPITGP
jgi:hypothetical protein